MLYLQTWFSFDVKVSVFFFVTFSYVITIGWAIFTVYLLSDYYKNYFYKSEYSPTQWAMVWALVGSQVLGVYVQGIYYPSVILSIVNYVSIVLAAILFIFVFVKFYQANKKIAWFMILLPYYLYGFEDVVWIKP